MRRRSRSRLRLAPDLDIPNLTVAASSNFVTSGDAGVVSVDLSVVSAEPRGSWG